MSKISPKELSDAVREYGEREFKNQFTDWLLKGTNPPACPNCDFEHGQYCGEHAKTAREVLEEL
jgi:hypothetical protein